MQGLYLFSILPPGDIDVYLDKIRQELSDKYNCHESLRRPVHLTLYPPIRMDAGSESKIPLIGKWVEKQSVFELHINGFDFFNKAKAPVVFAKPLLSDSLKTFQKGLQQQISRNLFMSNDYSFTPHITLAFRDLDPGYMPEIISDFGAREYKAAFIVNKIDVLKHDGRRWQKFMELPLSTDSRPDPLVLQAKLFS